MRLREHQQRLNVSNERGLETSALITPVSIKLCSIHNIDTVLGEYCGRLSSAKRANLRGCIRVEMYHGETCLCEPVSCSPILLDSSGDAFTWGKGGAWLSLPMSINDLAPAVRIIFKLDVDRGAPGTEDDTVAQDDYGRRSTIAWAGYNVLDFKRQLKTGFLQLCMWQGPCPSPTVPGFENVEGVIDTTTVLQIEIASYGQPVIYDDDDFRPQKPCWRILRATSDMTLQDSRIDLLLQKDGL